MNLLAVSLESLVRFWAKPDEFRLMRRTTAISNVCVIAHVQPQF